MKIAITNESYLSDEHIKELKEVGEVLIFENSHPDNIVERLSGVDIAVLDCFLTPITKELLEHVPSLKYFTVNSTGYDNIDVVALDESGAKASNVPSFSTDAVAELAVGLMFAVNRKITEGDAAFRESVFQVDPGSEEEARFIGFNLRNKTLGIMGLGDIGSRVAEIATGLGMKVIAYNRSPKEATIAEMKSFDEVITESDVLSLNVAYSDELEGMLSKEELSKMKTDVIIINTARGALVNNSDLAEALNNGLIAGAGLDLIEPFNNENPLLKARNVVFAPHNGFNTHESQKNMADTIVRNIKSYIGGSIQNGINE